ncbi:hypothetical protein D3C78_676060 [compost metagenome]
MGRVPLAQLGAFLHFATGLSQRFAHFQGNHLRHVRGVCADRAGQGEDQLGTFSHGRTAPLAEAGRSSGQCRIKVGVALVRVVADSFAVGGVDRHGMGLAGERGHGTGLQERRVGPE